MITTPSNGAQMWTWLGKYVFHDPIIIGNGIVINLTFFRPVPWVLTLPALNASTTISSSSTTITSSSPYWG